MDQAITDLSIPLPPGTSLYLLSSKIVQTLERYKTIQLVVAIDEIHIQHVGEREGRRDSLERLYESLELDIQPWKESLLSSLFHVTMQFPGSVARALFVGSIKSLRKALGAADDAEIPHVLGAEVIEAPTLRSNHQFIVGLARSYNAKLGDIVKIVLIEHPE